MLTSYLIPGSIHAEDTEEINSLLAQLSSDLKELSKQEIVEKLENPNIHVYVAVDEGVTVGMATLYIVDIFAGINARIEDVVVDEKYRGRRIASNLVESLIWLAREKGVGHIDLTSRPKRSTANSLYEKLGFQKISSAEEGGTNLFRLKLGGDE